MKKIKYTEPQDYLPKEIRDKFFGKKKATSTAKKTAEKKPAAKKSTKK